MTSPTASPAQVAPLVNAPDARYRILSLDGGGAKGFYTLGVLSELEAMLERPLHQSFDLIFGTSTGAIIAALIALGHSVEDIHKLYKQHVPAVMRRRRRGSKTRALAHLASTVFGSKTFTDVRTGVGIVAARWQSERPMIFKGSADQAHGMKATFVPGFGVSIADAVQASCSAFPFFDRKTVTTANGDQIELIDGGYCANNPTLYAIADAVAALKRERSALRVVSVGVGVYPPRKRWRERIGRRIPLTGPAIELLQKTLEINTQSMDQLMRILFSDVQAIRIHDSFNQPELTTDLLEHDLEKLNLLRQRGRESFASREAVLRQMLL